jgi:hypothetical protein
MGTFNNPALREFVAQIGNELTLAQVMIRRKPTGYELRHAADRDVAAETLRVVPLVDARRLAQYAAAGEFRPLKSAPTLLRGWRMTLSGDAELAAALDMLYPGVVADWFAARAQCPAVTGYREFTSCQSGMYRVTAILTDAQAANVIRECCAPAACLKRRLWTLNGLDPDAAQTKSIIPCLEPCAILLEAARKAFRAAQQDSDNAGSGLADDAAMH